MHTRIIFFHWYTQSQPWGLVMYATNLAGYNIYTNPFSRERSYTSVEHLTIQISFSYLLVDTAFGIVEGYNDLWMNIHHVIMFVCYSISLYCSNVATEMMVSIFFGEITNPSNLLRQIYAEKDNTDQSRFHGKIFVVSFMLVRVLLGPVIAWWFCSNSKMHVILQIGCCAMSKLSLWLLVWVGYIWAWRITNLAAKQLAQGDSDKESLANRFYARVKSCRKYSLLWNFVSFVWSFSWFGIYTFLWK